MNVGGITGGGTRRRPVMPRRKTGVRALATVCAAVLLVGLSGCAPEPEMRSAQPQALPRLELATLVAPPNPLDAATVPGLFPQRIVPSGEPWISARWSLLPGQNAFNEQQLSWVRAEMNGFTERTGGPAFAPRASPGGAGGAERGCAAGSTEAPATQLLADPALAPIAAVGSPSLALNCDVVFASGGLLGMRVRSTSRDAAGVQGDAVTTWYSMGGVAPIPAADFVDPAALGELGELLLASLGFTELPTMFVPSAIARPITADEVEKLGLARLITDSVPQSDGSIVFTVRIDELPGGGSSFAQRAEWVRAGVSEGGRVAVRVPSPEPWLSESGDAAVAAAVAAAPPAWQPVPAGRQAVDCGLVPCIAVTFDDGPGADSERLLQTLAETNSAASFFLQGAATAGAGGIAAAEAAAGHTIANHSWNHPDLTTLTKEQVRDQVMNSQRAIAAATGITPRYFRPPYGALNDQVAAKIPLSIVLWSIDTNDWRLPGEEALVERVSGAEPGDIILFHDTHAATVDAMPRVIGELQDRGLELVTLDLLLGEQPAGVRVSRG